MAKNKYKRTANKSPRSFRRSIVNNTQPGSSILIVTEGDNTEPIYFDAIKKLFASRSIELVTHGAGRGDPKKLTETALELQQERRRKARKNELSISQLEDFEQIWIVFDTDVLKPKKRVEGIEYAKSNGIKVAFSEPCFEYWLLLHSSDAYTTAPMKKCDDVKPFLKQAYGWTGYDKNKAECKRLILPLVSKDNVRTAVQASRRVRKHHEEANTPLPANPSTNVDLLIETINEAVAIPNKFL